MASQPERKHVFKNRGHSFVAILDGEGLGGPLALQDYLQMRSSQLVRQMRRMPKEAPEHARIKTALIAMSEASRAIMDATKPQFAPNPRQTKRRRG